LGVLSGTKNTAQGGVFAPDTPPPPLFSIHFCLNWSFDEGSITTSGFGRVLLPDLAGFYFRIWHGFASGFGTVLLPDLAVYPLG